MKKQVIAGVIGLGLLIGAVWLIGSTGQEMNEVSAAHHSDDEVAEYEIYPGDVVEKLQQHEDVVLLDVRTPEEYAENHLEDALLLPVQELSQQTLNAIGLGEEAKDTEIILYCRSGSRSKTAYDIMKSLGYTNIKSVSGGMIHWEEDEYPFTTTGEYQGAVSSAADTMGVTDGPQIVVDRKLHDFGEVPQFGGKVETTFTVSNTGTEVLEIGTLTTSCSCTSATIDNAAIKPGESAVMTVVFDPNFHAEPLDVFKRTVFITTNDPNDPEAEVSVQVDILEGQ